MKSTLSVLAAAAALCVTAPAFAGNLITNGDFSTPNTSGGWGIFNAATTGWTNSADNGVEIGSNGTYALPCYSATICQNLEVNANTFGDVSQTVTGLTAGQSYTLSFAYGGRNNGGGPQAMDVLVNGVQQGGDIGGSLGVWTPYSFTFKATGSSETIEFKGLNLGGSPSYGDEITAVSLTGAVPEPSTWALLFMGVALAGASLRRRAAMATARV